MPAPAAGIQCYPLDKRASISVARILRPAPHEPAERRDPAADHEAGHGRADQELLAPPVDLLAPVGDLGHLGAQAVDRHAELGAVRLDRPADLLGRAGRGHQRLASAAVWRAPTGSDAGDAVRVPLISCASSSASSGFGGEPFLISRRAIRPAIPPSSRISPPVITNPSQKLSPPS